MGPLLAAYMLGAMTAHAWHSDEYMKVKGKKQVKKRT